MEKNILHGGGNSFYSKKCGENFLKLTLRVSRWNSLHFCSAAFICAIQRKHYLIRKEKNRGGFLILLLYTLYCGAPELVFVSS